MKRLGLFLCAALLFAPVLGSQQGYIPFATEFDGSNDFYLRGGDLTGNTDTKEGLLSFWFRFDDGGNNDRIIDNTGETFEVIVTTADKIRIIAENSAGTDIFQVDTATALATGDGVWHHFMASWNLADGSEHLYVDGSEDLASTTNDDDAIDYTVAEWVIGARINATLFFDGGLSELDFSTEYLDLSIESNRRLFINSDGKPVDLGPGCHLPTGTVSIICMQTQFNGFGQNSGTGGDFTPQDPVTSTPGPVAIFQLPGRANPPTHRGRGGRSNN